MSLTSSLVARARLQIAQAFVAEPGAFSRTGDWSLRLVSPDPWRSIEKAFADSNFFLANRDQLNVVRQIQTLHGGRRGH